MPTLLTRPTGTRQTLAAGFLLIAMAATIASVLLFQHVGGYLPCALCLTQRIPYYAAIPVALAAYVAAAGRAPPALVRLLLLAIGLAMLVSLALAAWHAGIEWGFWAGPAGCAQVGGGAMTGGDLLSAIDAVRPPACEDAAGRFLGLSFAGWNVLASALFAAVALSSAAAPANRFA